MATVGGTKIARAQLDHLIELAAHPAITLHVIPFGAGGHPGLDGEFTILDFPDKEDPPVAYQEGLFGDIFVEAPDDVARYYRAADTARGRALTPRRLGDADQGREEGNAMIDEQGWITSSYSGSGQQCVQMKPTPSGVTIRDSKNPDGPRLLCTPDAWQSLVTEAKNGSYDLPAHMHETPFRLPKPVPGDLGLTAAEWLLTPNRGDIHVSIAFVDDHIAMRLSPLSETLVFTPGEWNAWLSGARDGEFDHLP